MKSVYSISVILPCYNVAQYMERATDSIFMQDFEDYEVIIVNDGSPDNLLDVCRKWENMPNVTILTTPNQGVAQARNEGLNIAKGEYIYFMGPCMSKFIGFSQNDFNNWLHHNPWKYKECASVWRFMFRRALLEEKNIRFPKGVKLSEDKYFVLNVMLHSTKVCSVEDVFYNYIIRASGGLVNSLTDSKNLLKAKIDGVVERGKLRAMAKKQYGEDVFTMYIGTIVLGVVEIIVRGASLPIIGCLKDANLYMKLEEVKEAYRKIFLCGLPMKFRIPTMMVKYHMTYLLVVLIHIANKLGIKLSAF